MELRVHLKICEGCGCLWYRPEFEAAVYCAPCDDRLKHFPTAQSRKRRGRPKKVVNSTVFAAQGQSLAGLSGIVHLHASQELADTADAGTSSEQMHSSGFQAGFTRDRSNASHSFTLKTLCAACPTDSELPLTAYEEAVSWPVLQSCPVSFASNSISSSQGGGR